MSTSPSAAAPVPPAAAPSRAGRDLRAAVLVGAGLAALIVGSLLLWKPAFVGLAVVAIVLAVWELASALSRAQLRVPLAPVVLGAVAMLVAAYAGGPEPLVAAFALTASAVVVWRLLEPAARDERPTSYVRDATAGIFAALYVPLLASFAMLMLREDDGAGRVVVYVAVTVFSDIGGYAAGILLGRHPMAPHVSPKKSWEGFAGSVLACAVTGAVTVPLLLDGSVEAGVLVGLAACVSATLGDLGESLVKRDLSLKDMGSLLPGHGGLMDRLDSLLPTAPVVFLLLAWLVPAG